MPSVSIALLGFGTVGRAVAKLVTSGRHPSLRLTIIFNRGVARKRVPWVPSDVTWTDRIEDVLASPADVVIELVGGREPARTWIAQALERGKAVVTANKQVIAQWGPDLLALAERRATALRFEAAVGAGLPLIEALHSGLAGDEILGIAGVINGTCNYVLTRMERDAVAFETAVREAQTLGYAEADPAEDVDGLDARAKLAILALVGLGCRIAPEAIPTESLREIEPVDFHIAREQGYTIRQIARVDRAAPDTVVAAVGPMLVPLESPLARPQGNENLVLIRGRWSGDTWLGGPGAGGDPTAVAVVSDVLALARGERLSLRSQHPVAVREERETSHYVRLRAARRVDPARAVSALLAQGLAATAMTAANVPATDTLLMVGPSHGPRLRAALAELAASHAPLATVIVPVYSAARCSAEATPVSPSA